MIKGDTATVPHLLYFVKKAIFMSYFPILGKEHDINPHKTTLQIINHQITKNVKNFVVFFPPEPLAPCRHD